MRDDLLRVANAIRLERFPDAAIVFVAGSLVRGEGTASSDLDLVVIYAQLPAAYRESFRVGDYPVEAFVHDPETLEYFFSEVDGPSGVPALAQMVVEGIETQAASNLSRVLKERAAAVIAAGPPRLETEHERRLRYMVTDLLDDLRDPRSEDERNGIGARLYEQLADYHLRRLGLWSGRGKAIPRALERADPDLRARYCGSFGRLFRLGDTREVIVLAEDLLRFGGGLLFDGYRAAAPASWRKSTRGRA